MKKFALFALLIVGCAAKKTEITKSTDGSLVLKTKGCLNDMDISVVEFDGCEYVVVGGGKDISMTHKGNCKFCKDRATGILR